MTRHYVISDLHLGMGQGDELEDFKSDAAFKTLLDHIEEEGGEELIINGDWLDFPQLEPLDSYKGKLFSGEGHRLGWTEDDSLKKLESTSAERAHLGFFKDLRSFLNDGRKLTVIMGNHDPDLFWDKVQTKVRALLGDPPNSRLEFVRKSIRRGTSHIEHGNQRCSPENKFANPDEVFHQCADDGKIRLEMVWGTIFVMEFFNDLERKYPFADNIKTQYLALKLGIKNGWVGGLTAFKLVQFAWGAGLPGSLDEIASWTLSADEKKRPDQLIIGLHDKELAGDIMKLYRDDAEFQREFDEELKRTRTEEWATMKTERRRNVTAAELKPLDGPDTMGLFREALEFRAARELLSQNGIKQVLFGHTHTELDGAKPDAKVANYFNTGTWTNSLNLAKKEIISRTETLTTDDLKDDSLFDLRLMYTLIEVDDNNESHVSLRQLNVAP